LSNMIQRQYSKMNHKNPVRVAVTGAAG
jgi:hypothetical protein